MLDAMVATTIFSALFMDRMLIKTMTTILLSADRQVLGKLVGERVAGALCM
jgi:hypothetical protein